MKKENNKLLTTVEEMEIGVENAVKFFSDQIPVIGTFVQRIDSVNQGIRIKYMQKYLIELHKFIESGAIQKETLDMVNEYFTSEDGQEYLYLSIEKSKKIRHKDKREYLRNLFLNHSSAVKPMDIDNAEKYLNILENLDIEAVLILKYLSSYMPKNVPNKGVLDYSEDTIKENKEEADTYLQSVEKEFKFEHEDITYYHQQLITNGLAKDDGMGRLGTGAFEIIKITKMGNLFLNFINKPV